MESKERMYPQGDYPPLKHSKMIKPTEIAGGNNTYYSRERWRNRRDHWANEERQAGQTGNDEYAVLCRRMKNMYADRLKRAVK